MNHLTKKSNSEGAYSRREFIKNCAMGTMVLATSPLTSSLISKNLIGQSRGACKIISLDQDWLFGGKFDPIMLDSAFDDSVFSQITIPHCVTNLSWQDWNPSDWQDVWIYRKHFKIPEEMKGMRIFLHFDGVMVGASPTINGCTLPKHLGGYLPFRYEITDCLRDENLLTVLVDSRWTNTPPEGSPAGTKSIDYLEPGGIHRSVRLECVPQIFISDVYAKSVRVLESDRRINISCKVDASILPKLPVQLMVELKEGTRIVCSSQEILKLEKTGQTEISVSLSNLGNITLWDTINPYLYDIVITLLIGKKPIHNYHTKIGLRDIRFDLDGFFLNGRRLQLFGLNRHEIFPYLGFALPDRVMRHDAEILRKEFNCNMVRCSHYPQSEAFLNACDELGVLVWEEIPGWQYLGDESWKELVVQNVKEMITRDRNHPSIIIWGTRINESNNDVVLYKRTKELARSLDDSRPSSGSMTPSSRENWMKEWNEDVFTFDDYHSDPEGDVGIQEPVEGFPYLIGEAIGQFNYSEGNKFDCKYRRSGELELQKIQAIRHAKAHNKAASNPRICGVIAWCAFDYASLINSYRGIKCPGVADIFRIPKLGASFYQSQIDPKIAPVIHPNFYWDFGPESLKGPGQNVAVFSNCDKLELFIDGLSKAVLHPDSKKYPKLDYPPFFTDLEIDKGETYPELRIDGYLGDVLSLSRSFSSNPEHDQFLLAADDQELIGNGCDATRVVFRVVDKYGAARPFVGGEVTFKIGDNGIIIGNNPFSLEESGGAGAIYVKTKSTSSGLITLQASHSTLGTKIITILILPETNL